MRSLPTECDRQLSELRESRLAQYNRVWAGLAKFTPHGRTPETDYVLREHVAIVCRELFGVRCGGRPLSYEARADA